MDPSRRQAGVLEFESETARFAEALRSQLDDRPLAPVVYKTIWLIALGFALLIAAASFLRDSGSTTGLQLDASALVAGVALVAPLISLLWFPRHLKAYRTRLESINRLASSLARSAPLPVRPASVSALLEEARQVIAFGRGMAEFELADAESTGASQSPAPAAIEYEESP